MTNEEIIIRKQKEFNLYWDELSTYRALMELARQGERQKLLKALPSDEEARLMIPEEYRGWESYFYELGLFKMRDKIKKTIER